MTDDRPVDGQNAAPLDLSERYASTQHIARFFDFEHLPPHLKLVSMHCASLAETMMRKLTDGPELTAGLRKLLEAKDCFVRQAKDMADEVDR